MSIASERSEDRASCCCVFVIFSGKIDLFRRKALIEKRNTHPHFFQKITHVSNEHRLAALTARRKKRETEDNTFNTTVLSE